ncbi:MAG: M28 family peptidase [Omnitrophica WOR_2 bacterium]
MSDVLYSIDERWEMSIQFTSDQRDMGPINGNDIMEGWKKLVEGFPWFNQEGAYPIRAYSEFTPPPRLGRAPYGDNDPFLFHDNDPYGWYVSDIEEEYEIKPGLQNIANQVLEKLYRFSQGESVAHIIGHRDENLKGNPYWPDDLALHAGQLRHERYVVFLPLALSKTKDDFARVRWTLFGNSEHGPELAFWKSFFISPDKIKPETNFIRFIGQVLKDVYKEKGSSREDILSAGFRILPSLDSQAHFGFPNPEQVLPWLGPYLIGDQTAIDDIRYLLTFRPFQYLPDGIKKAYFEGQLSLLPFPGSLVFWGMPPYFHLQKDLPLAVQIPLLFMVRRHGGPKGIRIPQAGWFYEHRPNQERPEIKEELIADTYRRTHRWMRVHRYENELEANPTLQNIARALFSTDLGVLELYNKPMAKNCQLWTKEYDLLLDGPAASRKQIDKSEERISKGGLYGYLFRFSPMRVGRSEVYWQRPLVAYLARDKKDVKLISSDLLGYLVAYQGDHLDLARPVELWPRLESCFICGVALRDFVGGNGYAKFNSINVINLINTWRLLNQKPLPWSFADRMVRKPRRQSLQQWLGSLPEKAARRSEGYRIRKELMKIISEEETRQEQENILPEAITFSYTANRSFEENYWNDILTLAHGRYLNKDNADCVQDAVTLDRLRHHHRDLDSLGSYLLNRHHDSILKSGLAGKAFCGELPFHWRTDFDFPIFGGWEKNQADHGYERDLLVVIPGKNRRQALILADHYDTAYMEDIYNRTKKGNDTGARLASHGADDNHSATATLLQAAPIYLELARQGHLERDIWLLHLTGEEFPADCLGARHFCQCLVEKNLIMKTYDGQPIDFSSTEVVGFFVMDMIAHNRENKKDIFQISPGAGQKAIHLAMQAHFANMVWNSTAKTLNKSPERRRCGRGKRSKDGITIPPVAAHLPLNGEIRTLLDPTSTLYNTDGVIFSDAGVPAVLLMENYDINRVGYHDSRDTMENIDLDYGSALAAIAIETIARLATINDW